MLDLPAAYAVQPSAVTVTVIDAMGHGLRASMLGALAVGRCGTRAGPVCP
ncbi:MAG TPA: hypothetical protein VKP11_12365 [Frankiaceae bacterium]|nr:hypothetical protein [Frankiaceae bacterium]